MKGEIGDTGGCWQTTRRLWGAPTPQHLDRKLPACRAVRQDISVVRAPQPGVLFRAALARASNTHLFPVVIISFIVRVNNMHTLFCVLIPELFSLSFGIEMG